MDMNENTVKIGITGVIDVYHNNKQYPVQQSFTLDCFNGNTSRMIGDNYFIDECKGVVENTYHGGFKKYRKQLIREIHRHHTEINNYRGTLQDWLSVQSINFPYGKNSRVHQGILEALRGVYIKCNQCAAMSYMPGTTSIAEGCTVNDIADFIDAILMGNFDSVDSSKFDEGDLMVMQFLTAPDMLVCYNCNKPFACTSNIKPHVELPMFQHLYQGIAGSEESELIHDILYHNTAPPEFLTQSNQVYKEQINMKIRNILLKSKELYLNACMSMPRDFNDYNVFQHIEVLQNQRMTTNNMSLFDYEEMMILADVASIIKHKVRVSPSNLNTYLALHDISVCDRKSHWLQNLNLTLDVRDDITLCTVLSSCAHDHNLEQAIESESFLVAPKLNSITNGSGESYVNDEHIYLRTGGSDQMTKWCKRTS